MITLTFILASCCHKSCRVTVIVVIFKTTQQSQIKKTSIFLTSQENLPNIMEHKFMLQTFLHVHDIRWKKYSFASFYFLQTLVHGQRFCLWKILLEKITYTNKLGKSEWVAHSVKQTYPMSLFQLQNSHRYYNGCRGSDFTCFPFGDTQHTTRIGGNIFHQILQAGQILSLEQLTGSFSISTKKKNCTNQEHEWNMIFFLVLLVSITNCIFDFVLVQSHSHL